MVGFACDMDWYKYFQGVFDRLQVNIILDIVSKFEINQLPPSLLDFNFCLKIKKSTIHSVWMLFNFSSKFIYKNWVIFTE